MLEQLPQQKKELFNNIIFNNNQTAALLTLQTVHNPEDITMLKLLYDQKIAFDATYTPLKPPKPETQAEQVDANGGPSLLGTFCFFLYPQQNRELFDVTNEIFLKRFFAVFLFWKKNFLSVGGGKADLYGPLWLSLVYVALMGFMGNLIVYLVDTITFDFLEQHYYNTFGTVFLFTIAEIIFYPAVLSCLGGYMPSKDAVCIIGYSLVLYYVPTILCMFTSIAWYITCLSVQAITRTTFLYRNFSTRIESRTYILLLTFLLVEVFYAYILLQVVFFKYSGYTYVEGINTLTAGATSLTLEKLEYPPTDYAPGIPHSHGPAETSPTNQINPEVVVHAAHMLLLRHFIS